MKVLHVVRQFSPAVGGLESAVMSLARTQINELGIDARVVTLNQVFGGDHKLAANDLVAGVPVTRLAWYGSTRYPLAPAVLQHLRDAEIVHVHAIDFFFDFLALTKLLHRRTMVVSTHGGFFHTTRWRRVKWVWFNTLTRISALAYHRILACSESDRVLFGGVGGPRLRLIENGIDTEKFDGAAADEQTRTIIYFGRLTGHKRVQDLFLVLAALRALHGAWKLIVAGREAELTVSELHQAATKAGVDEAVTFVRNPNDCELRDSISKTSFFACLSRYEGFGIAAVEAMSAGLLPVLSDIAPFRQLRRNTAEGLIVNAAQPDETARAMENLILNDAGYAERKRRIIDSVRRYDWRHVAREYADVYNECLHPQQTLSDVALESRV